MGACKSERAAHLYFSGPLIWWCAESCGRAWKVGTMPVGFPRQGGGIVPAWRDGNRVHGSTLGVEPAKINGPRPPPCP